jgi:hypothetical protein
MKTLNWIAWISSGVGVVFVILGLIEDPRSKQRGSSIPIRNFLFMLANPVASNGEPSLRAR